MGKHLFHGSLLTLFGLSRGRIDLERRFKRNGVNHGQVSRVIQPFRNNIRQGSETLQGDWTSSRLLRNKRWRKLKDCPCPALKCSRGTRRRRTRSWQASSQEGALIRRRNRAR